MRAEPDNSTKGLLMPDPIRTIIPPELFDDEDTTSTNGLRTQPPSNTSEDTRSPNTGTPSKDLILPGKPLRRDPYGRDQPRHSDKGKSPWSVDSLFKYLNKVQLQIDKNLADEHLPTNDKLDNFIGRLIHHTNRQLERAPKKARRSLQATCRRLMPFWNFAQNRKVRSTCPEELRDAIARLIEAAQSEFSSALEDDPQQI